MTNAMMEKNFFRFSAINTEATDDFVDYLIADRRMQRPQVESVFRHNPAGISQARRTAIKRLADRMDRLLAGNGGITDDIRRRTNAMMERNLFAFSLISLDELETLLVESVTEDLTQDKLEVKLRDLAYGNDCRKPINTVLRI